MTSPSDSGSGRLRSAERGGTVSAVAEALFDDLTRQASDACGTAIAALSVLDGGHHWFKSRGSTDSADTPRALALCSETLQSPRGMVLPDLARDNRLEATPGSLRFLRRRAHHDRPRRRHRHAVRDGRLAAGEGRRRARLSPGAREGSRASVRHSPRRRGSPLSCAAPLAAVRGRRDGGERVSPSRRRVPRRDVRDSGGAVPLRQPETRRDPGLPAGRARGARGGPARPRIRPPARSRPHPRHLSRRGSDDLFLPGHPQGRRAGGRRGP